MKKLIEKLTAEANEYKERVNKLDDFLHSDKAATLEDYDLGLLQDQREEMIKLAVIIDLRIKSLNSYL